jgi:hypothetical protein
VLTCSPPVWWWVATLGGRAGDVTAGMQPGGQRDEGARLRRPAEGTEQATAERS